MGDSWILFSPISPVKRAASLNSSGIRHEGFEDKTSLSSDATFLFIHFPLLWDNLVVVCHGRSSRLLSAKFNVIRQSQFTELRKRKSHWSSLSFASQLLGDNFNIKWSNRSDEMVILAYEMPEGNDWAFWNIFLDLLLHNYVHRFSRKWTKRK